MIYWFNFSLQYLMFKNSTLLSSNNRIVSNFSDVHLFACSLSHNLWLHITPHTHRARSYAFKINIYKWRLLKEIKMVVQNYGEIPQFENVLQSSQKSSMRSDYQSLICIVSRDPPLQKNSLHILFSKKILAIRYACKEKQNQ